MSSPSSAVNDGAQTVLDLRMEVERLTRELDQVSSASAQSAQYGLSLLEEKSALEQKCEELETLYDNTRHELDITQEVSAKNYSNLNSRNSQQLCETD